MQPNVPPVPFTCSLSTGREDDLARSQRLHAWTPKEKKALHTSPQFHPRFRGVCLLGLEDSGVWEKAGACLRSQSALTVGRSRDEVPFAVT